MTEEGVGVELNNLKAVVRPATGAGQAGRYKSGVSVPSYWRLTKSASVFTTIIAELSVLHTQMAPDLVYLNPSRATTALVRCSNPCTGAGRNTLTTTLLN